MGEIDGRKKILETLIDYGLKLRGLNNFDQQKLDSWLPSVKNILPRNYLGRITRLSFKASMESSLGVYYYRISERAIDVVVALLKDEVIKLTFNANNERDLFALRIISARENSGTFELRLAERICGENLNYPAIIQTDLDNFFTNLGYQLHVSLGSRITAIRDLLMTLDSLQLLDLVQHGLFDKRYYQVPTDIAGKMTLSQPALQIAIEDFNQLLEESSVRTDPIGLSQIFGVSQTYDLLFLSEYKTFDDHLNSLLKDAKDLFWRNEIQSANEKLWDAFERLKTILDKDKKKGANQLIDSMVKDFEINDIINEFTLLTEFGNKYGIRHHETDKIILTTNIEKRYLYFRMLTLIDFAIKSIMGKELTD